MKPFTGTASVIFGIIALLHLLRLMFGISIVIGDFKFPFWMSIVGLVATTTLCIGLWKEAKGRI